MREASASRAHCARAAAESAASAAASGVAATADSPAPRLNMSTGAPPSRTDTLRSGLSLFRRLPPSDVAKNLAGVVALAPALTEDLLQRVDCPPQARVCSATRRRYLLCDYSRDGDSHRSPWSNAYEPPVEDGFLPSPALRALEVAANEALDAYKEAYYGLAAASSAYFWELEGGAFATCWLIKKDAAAGGGGGGGVSGAWDAIHVCEVGRAGAEQGADAFRYKLTSTVLLTIALDETAAGGGGGGGGGVGALDLSGSLTKQLVAAHRLDAAAGRGHVALIGGMVEAMEADIRGQLDALYSEWRDGARRPRCRRAQARRRPTPCARPPARPHRCHPAQSPRRARLPARCTRAPQPPALACARTWTR